ENPSNPIQASVARRPRKARLASAAWVKARSEQMAGSKIDKDEEAPPDGAAQEDLEGASAEETEQLRRDYLLQRFWENARGFWTGDRRAVAWSLSGGLV